MKLTNKTDGAPAMQFYVDDHLGEESLRLVPLEAQGLWIHMICRMWKSPCRGVLLKPNGQKVTALHLAAWIGQPEEIVKQLLSRLIEENVCSTQDDGTIYCRRMVREYKRYRSKVEAGRLGGRVSKRQAKPKQKGGSSTPASSPTPTSPTQKERQSDFDMWYRTYPRKRSPQYAKKAWLSLEKKGQLPPVQELIAAVEAQKRWNDWQKEGGRYVPNPASWLNSHSWENKDEVNLSGESEAKKRPKLENPNQYIVKEKGETWFIDAEKGTRERIA